VPVACLRARRAGRACARFRPAPSRDPGEGARRPGRARPSHRPRAHGDPSPHRREPVARHKSRRRCAPAFRAVCPSGRRARPPAERPGPAGRPRPAARGRPPGARTAWHH